MQDNSQKLYLKCQEDITQWCSNACNIHIGFLWFYFENDGYVLCLAAFEPSHHHFFLCTLKEKTVNIRSLNNTKPVRMYN